MAVIRSGIGCATSALFCFFFLWVAVSRIKELTNVGQGGFGVNWMYIYATCMYTSGIHTCRVYIRVCIRRGEIRSGLDVTVRLCDVYAYVGALSSGADVVVTYVVRVGMPVYVPVSASVHVQCLCLCLCTCAVVFVCKSICLVMGILSFAPPQPLLDP